MYGLEESVQEMSPPTRRVTRRAVQGDYRCEGNR